RPLDIAVIAAYCAAVVVFGLLLSGRQRDANDYFLGHRGLPWWAIMLSIVATETSALTIISVPGLAARGDLTFLQLSFGYLVGRIGVAAFLLPGYFEGTQDTAYQRLERRFGTTARRTASGVFARAWSAGKLVTLDFTPSFKVLYTFWGGVVGGALLAGASHGTDHLIVQRLLAARGLRDAQRALVGSGVFIILQFALFLLVGTSLWLAGADPGPAMRGDAIYPTFAVNQLPPGLAGLVIAGILAAAMSSHASAVNSLASASTQDFYAPLTGRHDPTHLLRVGRWLTLVWTAVLVAGAMAFRNQNTPVVQLALSIASITY